MNTRVSRRLAAALSLVMLTSTLLVSYTTRTYASQNASWDPLAEGLPDNLNQDPVDSLLQQLQNKNKSIGGNAPTPFQTIEDPKPAGPEEPVDLATGALRLNDQDLSFPTYGPPLEINRSYASDRTTVKGMFGYGWNIPQERYIQMFADFTVTDFQSDESRQNYLYTKNNPDLLVESYDGDSTLYYPLHEGSYTVQDPKQKTALTRRGADDYLLVEEQTGMRYAFAGYKAPWRSQPANAGKLLRYANRQGFVIYLDYDNQGRITVMRTNTPPKLQIEYQGELVHRVIDPQGRAYVYDYDGNQNLTRMTRPDGSTVEMTYDANHRITSRTVAGVTTRYQYDGEGRVSAILNGDGQPIFRYQYSGNTVTKTDGTNKQTVYTVANKKITRKSGPDGAVFSYEYNDLGKVTKVVTEKGTTQFGYDANGNLTRRVDLLGRETVIQYDTNLNLPLEIREPGGATWTYTYGDKGQVLAIENPLGEITTNVYDDFWKVILERHDPDGSVTRFEYNNFAEIESVTDPLGQTTHYQYDGANRLTEVRYPNGGKVSLLYENNGDKPTRIEGPTGAAKRFQYEKGRLVTSMDETANETYYYVYDRLGRLESKTDPLGHVTRFSYDGMGRVQDVTNPIGQTVSFTWDNNGRLKGRAGKGIIPAEYRYDLYGKMTEIKTPKGHTTLERDALGRVVKEIDGEGRITGYRYNEAGQVKEIVDAKQQVTRFEYDLMGRLTKKTDPLDGITSYVYDRMGRLTSVTDPWNRVTRYGYDVLGRLETAIDPENRTTLFQYDEMGNRTAEIRSGQITQFAYDLGGRLTKVIDPALGETLYAYDDKGLLKQIRNPLGHVTAFEHDPLGRVTQQTNPLGNSLTWTYDELGRVTGQTDARGYVTRYQYDVETRTAQVIRGLKAQSEQPETQVTGSDSQAATVYQYDEAGRLTAITDTRGNTTQYQYDEANELRFQIDPDQEKTEYRYDELGRLHEIVDPLGQVAKTEYDPLGRIVTEMDKAGAKTEYVYDPAGVYVDRIDPLQHRTRLEFDKVGQLIQQTDAMGGVTRFAYDSLGQLVKKTNALGHSTLYEYNALGNLTKVTDPKGQVRTFEYDGIGRLLKETNPLGFAWTYRYDEGSRLLEQVDPTGSATLFAYDPSDNVTKVTDPLQRTRTFAYDDANRLVKAVDPKGFAATFEYDGEGNLVKQTDEAGHAKETVYDKLNRPIQITDREGSVQAIRYDKIGRMISKVDGKGNETTYSYDPVGRLTEVSDAKQNKTQYQYDRLGNLLAQTDANGHITRWGYDKLSRVISETDALGNTTSFAYTPLGDVEQRTDPNGQVTRYRYDPNRLLTDVLYGNGTYKRFEYDAAGRVVRAANPAADETFAYDPLDRVESISNTSLGKQYTFHYDPVGNRTQIVDPDGRMTRYEYDERDQVTRMTDPDGFVTAYAYTATGLTQEKRGGDQTVTQYGYDRNGRTAQIKTTTPTGVLSSYAYTYDPNGNLLTQTEEDGAVTSYQYDELDRLTRMQYPKDKIEKIRNTYYTPPLNSLFPDGQDGSGQTDTTTPTVPEGPKGPDDKEKQPLQPTLKTDRLPDTVSDLTFVVKGGNGSSSGNGNSGGNSEGGNGNGNGPADPGSRGKGPKDKGTDDGGYAADEPQLYPDVPDYLLQPTAQVSYTYDAVGNMRSRTDDSGTLRYTYDAADRLLSNGRETYRYDNNGNLTERENEYGIVKYSYTPDNQLQQVRYPDDTYVNYQYDAFDRKVYREEQFYDLNGPGASLGHGKGYGRDNNPGQGNGYGKDNNPDPGSKGNGGGGKGKGKGNSGGNGNGHAYGRNNGISNYQLKQETTRYLYDETGRLLNEYTGEGDPLAQYYYANGEIVARKMFGFKGRKDQGYLGNLRDRGHLLFYHYDQIGNVTDLTDHLGSEVVKYRYDAFGGLFTGAWAPYNEMGLTGKSYDPKASLMDYAARWYSPNNQRFTTRDTWTGDSTLPQTLNRYAYALNNPLKYTDPTGHMPCYEDYDGSLHCGYSENPDDWGVQSGGTGGGQQEETYTPLPDNTPEQEYDPMLDPAYRAQQLLTRAGVAPGTVHAIFEALSMGLDAIPVVGNIKMFIQAVTGYDLVTGQRLAAWERVTQGVIAVLPGISAVGALLKAGKEAAKVAGETQQIIRYENYGELGNLEGSMYNAAAASRSAKGTGEVKPKVYSAEGNPDLRATRRPTFDEMKDNGVTVNGQTYKMNEHAYNSLFKSGRKDIMPDDIADALATKPKPAEAGSVEYINPATGTSVFVNPSTNQIVGVWPSSFKR